MIAGIILALTLTLGVVVGVVTGQPFIAVALAAGLAIGYGCALLFVPALGGPRIHGTGAAVDDAAGGWSEFHRELTRARRFERQFALVRLGAGALTGPEELVRIRDGVAGATRRIDRVWVDGEHLLLLLPEVNAAAVETALARIRSVVPEALTAEPGVALFPQHGITSGSLIAAAFGAGLEGVPTPISTLRPDHRPVSAPVDDGITAIEGTTPDELASTGG